MRTRRFLAMLAVIGLVLAVGAAPGDAQAAAQMTISPASGPPGTVITVTSNAGRACTDGNQHQAEGELRPAGGGTAIATYSVNTDNTTGFWSTTVTVPAGTNPGNFEVTGNCRFNNQTIFPYPTQPFQVTAPATTTTASTTTTAPTTTTAAPTTTTTAPPAASAAQAVRAQPAFTG